MDITKINEEMVRKKHMVAVGSEFCESYQSKHDKCEGCESEIGCHKVVALSHMALQSMLYEPKNFKESLEMQEHFKDKMKAILDAETVKEVNDLI